MKWVGWQMSGYYKGMLTDWVGSLCNKATLSSSKSSCVKLSVSAVCICQPTGSGRSYRDSWGDESENIELSDMEISPEGPEYPCKTLCCTYIG